MPPVLAVHVVPLPSHKILQTLLGLLAVPADTAPLHLHVALFVIPAVPPVPRVPVVPDGLVVHHAEVAELALATQAPHVVAVPVLHEDLVAEGAVADVLVQQLAHDGGDVVGVALGVHVVRLQAVEADLGFALDAVGVLARLEGEDGRAAGTRDQVLGEHAVGDQDEERSGNQVLDLDLAERRRLLAVRAGELGQGPEVALPDSGGPVLLQTALAEGVPAREGLLLRAHLGFAEHALGAVLLQRDLGLLGVSPLVVLALQAPDDQAVVRVEAVVAELVAAFELGVGGDSVVTLGAEDLNHDSWFILVSMEVNAGWIYVIL